MKYSARWASPLAAVLVVFAAALAGCGSSDDTTDSNKLVVYSGREAELVEPLYKKFEQESGLDVEVRYGESPELAATLMEEGENSPADVFYAQDAGAIGAVEDQLQALPDGVSEKVEERFRDTNGRWTGVTGRARVLAYNTDELEAGDLPASVLGLTDPKWKGRIGIAPGNASFQAFVTGMRESLGDEKTKQWLEDMKRNDVKTYEKNGQTVEAVAKGEIDAGLVNHYYLYEIKAEDPDAPVANHFFENGDPGTLVNVSAAGILASAPNKANAEKLIAFLMNEGQTFFAEEAAEREYPLVAGTPQPAGLPPLDEVKGPEVELSEFGDKLPASVTMIEAVGFPGT